MNENDARRDENSVRLRSELETVMWSALVDDVLTVTELKELASASEVNIMMGQTFDDGQPVDLVKYALFMMNLGNTLKSGGIKVTTNWLIADHFITDINEDEEAGKVSEQVRKRIAYLERINSVYGGNIGAILSSELSRKDIYQQSLSILLEEGEKNELFRQRALNAVPKDRRNNPNAYKYPFEEIATIQSMGADIKIGPVYEKKYDEPARDIAPFVGFKRYVAIQLSRGFLFGNPTVPHDIQTEIEEFGILPYKINSKGMSSYRLDPVNDSLEKTRRLILTGQDEAIADLCNIIDIAKGRLTGDSTPYLDQTKSEEGEITFSSYHRFLDEARALALDGYLRFLYNPLHLEEAN